MTKLMIVQFLFYFEISKKCKICQFLPSQKKKISTIYTFLSGKLEIGLTHVIFYSEQICTRCYYLYSLTLLELVGIY